MALYEITDDMMWKYREISISKGMSTEEMRTIWGIFNEVKDIWEDSEIKSGTNKHYKNANLIKCNLQI